jgi:hypothetical protein
MDFMEKKYQTNLIKPESDFKKKLWGEFRLEVLA